MTSPIAVVIPCRNVERDIGEAIVSADDAGDVGTIVCVDDGSTDGTKGAIEGAAERVSTPVTLIRTDGVGANAARNLGLERVDSVYCQFLDADDLLRPGKLAEQLRVAVAESSDVVVSPYVLQRLDGSEVPVSIAAEPWRGLIRSELGCTSSMLFSTEAVRSVGGWSESLASSQEYDLVFRIVADGGSIGFCEFSGTVKRERVGAISVRPDPERLERFVRLRARMADSLRAEGALRPDLEEEANESIFRSLRRMWKTDPGRAEQLFEELLPSAFLPRAESAAGSLYRRVFAVAGFRRTESFRSRLDRRS